MYIFFLEKGRGLVAFSKYIESMKSNHHSCLWADFLSSNILPTLKYFLPTLLKQLI